MNPPLPKSGAIVLGIDPGLATTGWGVIEKTEHGPRLLAYGAIETPARDHLSDRLMDLSLALTALIRAHQPAVLVIEELFFTKFATSISSTAQARGAILLTAAQAGVVVVGYNPRSIKMATTGFGSASKIQMQSMVQRLLKLKEIPRPDDAADAIAIALCHLQTNPSLKYGVPA